MQQRAHALRFRGTYDSTGRPDRYFPFAPARDLDAADIASLSDAEYADLIGGSKPLYAEVRKPSEKTPETKAKAEVKKAESLMIEEPQPSPDAPGGN